MAGKTPTEIVKFKDGKFGIRQHRSFGYVFLAWLPNAKIYSWVPRDAVKLLCGTMEECEWHISRLEAADDDIGIVAEPESTGERQAREAASQVFSNALGPMSERIGFGTEKLSLDGHFTVEQLELITKAYKNSMSG